MLVGTLPGEVPVNDFRPLIAERKIARIIVNTEKFVKNSILIEVEWLAITATVVHSRKLSNTTTSPALFLAVTVLGRETKILPALRANQIAGFVTVTSRKKSKHIFSYD